MEQEGKEQISNPGRYKGGRPKVEFRSASRSNYDRFSLENPTIKITYRQYEQIIREINLQYALHCLTTGNAVKLPYGMGVLAVIKKKSKKTFRDENGTHHPLAINWKETLKEGKKIYFLNEHTDGYHCHWQWFKKFGKVKMPTIWLFKACKKNSQLLKEFCFDTEGGYYLKYRECTKNDITK